MGKNKGPKVSAAKKVSLEKQLTEGKVAKQKNRQKIHLRTEESSVLDSKTSKKILAAAKQQQLEFTPRHESKWNTGLHHFSLDSEGSDIEKEDAADVCERNFMDDIQLDDEDLKAFERFQNLETGKRTAKLSDIILERIQEKQADIQSKLTNDESIIIEEVDGKIKELYEGVREVMKRYRGGKVPKAFKVIPKFRNWEQILFITEPHSWSAAAMFQGTRAFSSSLSQAMAQRFYNLVLLPRIRDDLCEYKKLNVHLYNSLKRALFKPAAFMKGIILPLLEAGDCTLREAIIFGSVIARNSVPVLHSSACLLKICEMSYTGANSIFIRYFLDKCYALPYRVVDAAVFHFIRFENDKRHMPVLWHQSLLTFVQRYKDDISSEQKQALFALLRKQSHPKITPEVRRELQAAKCRDIEMMECNNALDAEANPMYTEDDGFNQQSFKS